MRVLLVLGTSAGGVGRHVAGLSAGLAAAGHDVVVAGPNRPIGGSGTGSTGGDVPNRPIGGSGTRSTGGDVPNRPIGGFGTGTVRWVRMAISDRPHPVRDVRAVGALRRLARGADVVHAHGLRAGALACLATSGTRTPVVVTLHNAAPGARSTRAVYAVLERVVARRAAVVLGVSRDLAERATALGARHTGLAVVPAPARRPPGEPAHAVRAALGVPDGAALAVCVARLAPQKGLDTLLDAAALLRDEALVVAVAGDGPLEQSLKERVEREALPVRLLGRRDDVPDLLAAADVVVSSAVWEGQPLGLQEALQAGAAIVATDAGGTGETLRGAGRLVPVADAAALAVGIRAILRDPAEKARLQTLARTAAEQLPTEADAVAAAVSTYRDVARS